MSKVTWKRVLHFSDYDFTTEQEIADTISKGKSMNKFFALSCNGSLLANDPLCALEIR